MVQYYLHCHSYNLKMEAGSSCETLVTSYPSNSGHIPGDSHLHRHSRENLKPDELILTINHLSTHWSGTWPLSLGFFDNILRAFFVYLCVPNFIGLYLIILIIVYKACK